MKGWAVWWLSGIFPSIYPSLTLSLHCTVLHLSRTNHTAAKIKYRQSVAALKSWLNINYRWQSRSRFVTSHSDVIGLSAEAKPWWVTNTFLALPILFKSAWLRMCAFVHECVRLPISVADTDMLCQACASLSSGLVVVIMPSSELMLKNCSTSVYRGIMYLRIT